MSKCAVDIPGEIDLFSSVGIKTNEEIQADGRRRSQKKALKNVNIIEKILLDEESAVLRNRIIEIAIAKSLTVEQWDQSDFYFKMLTAIPGTRKMDEFRVFPHGILNGLDEPSSVHSFFFRAPKNISPDIEVVKLGSQPCIADGRRKKIPFLLFRLSTPSYEHKEIKMGLFNLKTIGLSYKALCKQKPNVLPGLENSFRSLLGKILDFKIQEVSDVDAEKISEALPPRIILSGKFNIAMQQSSFGGSLGNKKRVFGFYAQDMETSLDTDEKCQPMYIHYDYHSNMDARFPVWTTKSLYPSATPCSESLWIHDIYITIDSIAPTYDCFWSQSRSNMESVAIKDDVSAKATSAERSSLSSSPPPYMGPESTGESDCEERLFHFSNTIASKEQKEKRESLQKKRQKVIVDLGQDRFLMTSMDILETMVSNKLYVDNPEFQLPQRDKNLSDWFRETQEKLFPTVFGKQKASDLVLPSF